LSPVIATVLLIALVLVLAAIIFMWARGFISEQIEKFGTPIEDLCDSVDFDIEIVKVGLGYDFEIGNFSLYPSLVAVYQSSKFLDYYYGVKQSEVASSTFYQYTPDNGFLFGAQTYIKYPFTEQLSAFANIRVDRLSQEVIDSPIVTQKYIYSGLPSLIYTFKY